MSDLALRAPATTYLTVWHPDTAQLTPPTAPSAVVLRLDHHNTSDQEWI